MAKMNGRVAFVPDADASVMLRDDKAAAITATTAETGVSLKRLLTSDSAYWDNNEVPAGEIEVGVAVKSVDRTTGDETYVFTLEVGNSVFASPVVVATSATVTEAGAFKLCFDAKVVEALGAAYTHIRIKATLAGTTPVCTYGAWLISGAIDAD